MKAESIRRRDLTKAAKAAGYQLFFSHKSIYLNSPWFHALGEYAMWQEDQLGMKMCLKEIEGRAFGHNPSEEKETDHATE